MIGVLGLALIGVAPPPARAGTSTAACVSRPSFGWPSSLEPAGSAACAPTVQSAERPVSWKLLVPNILRDQKPIWFFPLAVVKGEHLAPTFGVTMGTAGLVALDPHDAPYFRRTSSFMDFNRVFSGRNTGLATAAFPLSFYAIGLARRDKYAQHTALLSGEAAADATIVMAVMKGVSRRWRPSDIAPSGDFTHTWFKAGVLNGSFPSGHAIAAFSVAAVFADRYHRHRWEPWLAYGLAGLVGFSRIPLQAHFPSDVFAGAALGYAIARYDVLRH